MIKNFVQIKNKKLEECAADHRTAVQKLKFEKSFVLLQFDYDPKIQSTETREKL